MKLNRATPALVFGVALLVPSSLSVWGQNPVTRALINEAGAQSGPTNARGLGAPGGTVQDRLAKVRADLAAAIAMDDASVTNRPPGVSFEELSMRRGLLQRLAQLYEQQIGYATELETLKNRRLELAREAKSWTGFTEPRPYPAPNGSPEAKLETSVPPRDSTPAVKLP